MNWHLLFHADSDSWLFLRPLCLSCFHPKTQTNKKHKVWKPDQPCTSVGVLPVTWQLTIKSQKSALPIKERNKMERRCQLGSDTSLGKPGLPHPPRPPKREKVLVHWNRQQTSQQIEPLPCGFLFCFSARRIKLKFYKASKKSNLYLSNNLSLECKYFNCKIKL